MHVLIINGSPRAKGNSDLLCDEFIRGAKEAGHQVEKISLREKSICLSLSGVLCLLQNRFLRTKR